MYGNIGIYITDGKSLEYLSKCSHKRSGEKRWLKGRDTAFGYIWEVKE